MTSKLEAGALSCTFKEWDYVALLCSYLAREERITSQAGLMRFVPGPRKMDAVLNGGEDRVREPVAICTASCHIEIDHIFVSCSAI